MLFLLSCAFVPEADLKARLDPDGDQISLEDDCDSTDPLIGERTEWFYDGDGDGFGDPEHSEFFCGTPEEAWVLSNTDCDDRTSIVSPSALEICDGKDNNCDGLVDDLVTDLLTNIDGVIVYFDSDQDGF